MLSRVESPPVAHRDLPLLCLQKQICMTLVEDPVKTHRLRQVRPICIGNRLCCMASDHPSWGAILRISRIHHSIQLFDGSLHSIPILTSNRIKPPGTSRSDPVMPTRQPSSEASLQGTIGISILSESRLKPRVLNPLSACKPPQQHRAVWTVHARLAWPRSGLCEMMIAPTLLTGRPEPTQLRETGTA